MTSIGNRRRRSGARGEEMAVWFLEQRGYRVLGRNIRLGRFEIDLVVEKGSCLAFVEVKRRSGSAWVRAGASLAAGQRQRLASAASAFVARVGRRYHMVRYDVVTVDESERALTIEHYPDALGAGGELR
jgi:putative endonuclease